MSETFTFEPTAYEVAKGKAAKQTPKQVAREFKKQYKIAMARSATGRLTEGSQLVEMKRAARVCESYGQPIPVELRCLIAHYEGAEATA